jgi:hypothetical protein
MNGKQIVGIVAFGIGVGLLCLAHYINVQVAEGNTKIFNAQKKVDQGNSLFSLSPYSKSIGQGMTSGAQKKINEGKNQVAYYTIVAERCQFGGIGLMIVGVGMIYFCRNRTSNKKRR